MKCEKLDVWKKSARFSSDVYKAFKECKYFGFKDQITRTGLSIPNNIAKGMKKESPKEQVRLLDIAKGSAAEFATQTYIDRSEGRKWIEESETMLSMLSSLQKVRREKIVTRSSLHVTRN
ncbi:four helix bundle protein [Sulfurovum sp. ST-21]|uniref:Four helix bundle protein n=1 Tax=Sulfurovum indicum TaxID=2779528 RepID=A0A7M1S683_9BACT|nr:four helix bundle protein [Sulfurovum indicum]QOR62602.1 four helix bundle protein [Sulfurovum indicum]